MNSCAALILAAGKGTRMKSEHCKVLHSVAGKPMLFYVIDAVRECGVTKIAVVVGHQSDRVKTALVNQPIDFALQHPQLGTGHAVQAAEHLFETFQGDILVLCGDTPLITAKSLMQFIDQHQSNNSFLSVMTGVTETPFGYGRIVRDGEGNVSAIIEERDADDHVRNINEVNTGIYLVDSSLLFDLLSHVKAENSQKEYYLTDIVKEAVTRKISVHGWILHDFSEASGINTRAEMASASTIIWNRTRQKLMQSGVTLLDPNTAFIDSQVEIRPDTVIHPVVTIAGSSIIGSDCIIESGCYIIDSTLGNNVHVMQGSRINESSVADGCSVGPMAHLRPQTTIGEKAKIGNFVEIKKSSIGPGTKASHLTYIGDSRIGKNTNIGCGTITCNYDGHKKHATIIGDDCFVGSDVQFVAPVEIGNGSLIGAGSTITKNVPAQSLAISRSRQKVYPLRKGQGSKSSDENR